MELKNTAWELYEVFISINSWIDQIEERILNIEDQLNKIKCEDKIREKRMKNNKQSLQEIWDYVAKHGGSCILGGRGRWITRSRDQDHPGQHRETLFLLKIQKILAGYGGSHL